MVVLRSKEIRGFSDHIKEILPQKGGLSPPFPPLWLYPWCREWLLNELLLPFVFHAAVLMVSMWLLAPRMAPSLSGTRTTAASQRERSARNTSKEGK